MSTKKSKGRKQSTEERHEALCASDSSAARAFEAGYILDLEPDPDVARMIAACLDEHGDIFELLGVPRPAVVCILGLHRGHLARFVNGTSSDPLIVFDSHAVKKTAMKYGVLLLDGVESTLLHEYGHVYVESVGAEPDDEERIVEAFAKRCWLGDHEGAVEQLVAEVEGLS